MQTKHWIPLDAHAFKGKEKLIEHEERCQACGEDVNHARHRADLQGAAVIDFLQSQGDGFVETKAVIMLADGGLDVRTLISRSGRPMLYAAPAPGSLAPVDIFEESPTLPPPFRPSRSRRSR